MLCFERKMLECVKPVIVGFLVRLVSALIMLTIPPAACDLNYVGCYEEGIGSREMNISAGNYDPAQLTPGVCARLCRPNHRYAGLRLGKLCFCGDSYGKYGKNTTECNHVCSGDITKVCGGDSHNSIYEVPSSVEVSGVISHSVVSPNVVTAFSDAFFTVEVEGPGFASLVVDFGDGYTETLLDQHFCHRYISPGHLPMKATVIDLASAPYPTTNILDIQLPVLSIERHCPLGVLGGQEFDCEFSSFGTGMDASVDIEGIGKFNFSLADATVVLLGPDLDQMSQPAIADQSALYMKVVNRVQEDALLVGWEVVILNPGDLVFAVYRPQPIRNKQFCHRSLTYLESSEECLNQPNLMEHRCTGEETFSFTKRSCVNTRSGVTIEPDTSQLETLAYVEVSRYNFMVNETGRQFIPVLLSENRFILKAGDLIGYLSQGAGVVHRISPQDSREGDIQMADSSLISISSSLTPSPRQYLYRAVTVHASRFYVQGMYPQNSTLGPRNILVSVKNPLNSETLDELIHIENIVDNVTLTVDPLAETFAYYDLTVDHVGRVLAYEWKMGDGTLYNTTDNFTIYHWKSANHYNVSVRVINYYNWESDMKVIIVEERICGLNWTSATLDLHIQLGSQVALEWNAENGSSVHFVFEFDWNLGSPATNFSFDNDVPNIASLPTSDWALNNFKVQLLSDGISGSTTFTPEMPGNLSISLLITNLVSQMRIHTNVIIQSAITGFSVLPIPPQKFGDDVFVKYNLASGSDVSVNVTLDGYPIHGGCTTVYLEGECLLQANKEYFEDGEYSIELTANNKVSGPAVVKTNLIIQIAFDISNFHVRYNPGFAIVTGSFLNIAFDIELGSEINYEMTFKPGSLLTGNRTCLAEGQLLNVSTSSHFFSPGKYLTGVLAWNLISRVNYSADIVVQNPVKDLLLITPLGEAVIGIGEGDAYVIPVMFGHNGSDAKRPTDAVAIYSFPPTGFADVTSNISNVGLFPITQYLDVPRPGRYAGSVMIFNLVSKMEFPLSVEVEEFITNVQVLSVGGLNLFVNEENIFSLNMSWGSRITFELDYGDHTTLTEFSENRGLQTSHIYRSTGQFQIQVLARNILGSASASTTVRLFRKVEGFSLAAPLLNRLPPGGLLSISVLLYIQKSIPPPNNATIVIRFDTSDQVTYSLDTVNCSRSHLDTPAKFHMCSFPVTYNTTGKFSVSVSIFNPASSQDLTLEYWIYEEISDLQAEVKYNEFAIHNVTEGDSASDQPAVNSVGLYLPIDHAIVLVATYASGTDLTFTWNFGETPGVFSVTRKPREIFWYNDPGTYTVSLKVSNPINFEVTNVTIHVQVPVADITLTLLDIGDQSSNVTMYFEVDVASLGTDACYRIDFKDSQIAPVVFWGSRQVCLNTYRFEIDYSPYPFVFEPIDLQSIWEEKSGPWAFNVTNIFDHYGFYSINATGSNIVSSSTYILHQYVRKPDCFKPIVSVNESNRCDDAFYQCDVKTKYRVYLASVQIIVTSRVSLNCKSSNRAWYEWRLFYTGDRPGEDGTDYELPDDISAAGLSLGSLSIKPATLTYGWYHIYLNVSMYQEYPPIFATDSTYIRIDPSPLQVHISGGDERAISHNNSITVDAKQLTYDPDVPRRRHRVTDFKFLWLCRRKSYFSAKTRNTTYNVEPFEIWDRFYTTLKKDGSVNKNDEIDASDGLNGITDRGGCFGLSQKEEVPAPGGKLIYSVSNMTVVQFSFGSFHQVGAKSTTVSMYMCSKGKLPFTTGRITFSTAPMYFNMKYELKVVVIKGERIGEATQTLDIKEGVPPILLTFCKVNCKSKLNPSNRYSVESQQAFGTNNFFSLYYMWSIYVSINGKWKHVPVEAWKDYNRTLQDSANFVMDPGFFQESTRYKLKLMGSRNPDFQNSGLVSVLLNVNDRPRNGTCSVSLLEGQALVTDFDISCKNWQDVHEDLPLSYTFKVEMVNASARTIHASTKPQLEQPTKLNQGSAERDYMVPITIDVTDSYGCFRSIQLAVKVYPPNADTDTDSQLNLIESNMKQLFADGEKESAANLVIAAADFLNTELENNGTQSPKSEESSVKERELKSGTEKRTKMRTNMASMLSQNPKASTVEDVQQLTSAMAAVTKVPEEVSLTARTKLLSSMTEYSKTLQENAMSVDPISVEMLEAATSVCMEVVGNLVESAYSTNLDEGEGADEENMAKSEEVVDRLAATISAKMVLGQSDIKVPSVKSSLILAKSPALWISNKNFSTGGGNFLQLPLYEDLFQDTDNYTAVTQKFIVRNVTTKLFVAGATEVDSMVVALTLINDTDQMPLAVANTTSPIEISIARNRQHLATNGSTSNDVYVEKTAPVGGAMIIHEIDIPHDNALSLEVKALGTDDMKIGWSYDVILYVFARNNGNPSRALHNLNCTLRQTLTAVEGSDLTANASLELGFSVVFHNDSQTRCFFSMTALDNLRNGSSLSLRVGVNHEVLHSVPPPEGTGRDGLNAGSSSNDIDQFHPMVYAMRSSLYTCLAIGEGEKRWSSSGCQVGENSTDIVTQCFCNHLTTFGAGFRIPINKIDLSNSAFTRLNENPVVFTFMICCLLLYVLVIVWARKADKRDIIMAGVTPLPDNDPRDRFLYEVTVYTGMNSSAGTTASVIILLSGELGNSHPRVLCDPKRKVFQRGGVDSFLLASPVSLGNLIHLKVWHDNGGKQPAWYLSRIMIKDLQHDQMFYFVANCWLAVEEDDGMIERVLPVAGRSELTSFGHLFLLKSRRNFNDTHLWFSVFTRPVKSKFTRVQRATCCLSLLFCTMMANILFYQTNFEKAEANQVVYSVGPIKFTFGEVVIGVISSLMVFPINLVVVQLFRLSRPIPACTCTRRGKARGNTDIRTESKAQSDLEKELAGLEAADLNVPSISLKLSRSQRSFHSTSKLQLDDPTSDTTSESSTFEPVLGFKKTRRIKKGPGELPWGFCVLTWLLVLASVGVAFWLTIEVAGQFGKDKAAEWLMSMCFSLIQDIFFTQPIKVVVLAIFFSLIIRDPEQEENSNLMMAPHLQDDEEWLHARMTAEELEDPGRVSQLQQQQAVQSMTKTLAPLHPEELNEARQTRFKEIKMHKIIWEIIFYIIFLNITMLVCFGDRDPSTFYVNKSMKDMFVKAAYNGRLPFTKIRGRETFWNYTENVFLPSLYSYHWYNGQPDLTGTTQNMVADSNMHLIGRVRFRQLRVQKDACAVPDIIGKRIQDCRAEYGITVEDSTSYDVRWQPLNESDPPDYSDRYHAAWKYNHWYDISSFPYYGKHAFYNGGGYIIELGRSLNENLQIAADLRQDLWIDQYTRALFLEFVVYNPNINMYATSFLLVEFLPQGGATSFPYFWSIRLDRYSGTFGYFVIAGQVLYTLFILYFLSIEVRCILREKCKYVRSAWNLCEVTILGLAVSSMVVYFYRLFVGKELGEQWQTSPKMFLNFHYVAYWDQLYGYLSSFVLFLVNIKFIRLLRFNRKMLLFSLTLRQCSADLIYYVVVFGIVFTAFTLFAYALFHLDLANFSSFISTLETLFSTILGKFNFQEMISVHSILGPAFFFTYVIIIVFVMINMFLSIINEAFGQVRHDSEALENELEIVDFMIQRFKRWSGFSERRPKNSKTYHDYIEGIDPKDMQCRELGEKLTTMVDRLNQFIISEKGLRKSPDDDDRPIFLSN